MKMVSVLLILSFELFSYVVQTISLIEGMSSEREMKQDEISSQKSLLENGQFPLGYDEGKVYSKIEPMYEMSNYRAEIMKRSLGSHNPRQRQTGIIYGGGKPIGILQPYQESFKFMPIREERSYGAEGSRPSLDQQEYMSLMYPISRFARSEDAVRMAEEEAAKVEFLDKHYPSMLVDFKIYNKLHPSEQNAKAAPDYNHKREETNNNMNTNEQNKKKRENVLFPIAHQKLKKRDNQHFQKGETVMNKQVKYTAATKKREEKRVQREIAAIKNIERQVANTASQVDLNKAKKKRENRFTDSQFENLKNSLAKRNANGHMKFVEEDLKGLLSDMGLIENDFPDNSDPTKESKRRVIDDEHSKEGLVTTSQKEKNEFRIKKKREQKLLKKRSWKRREKKGIIKRKEKTEKAIMDEEKFEHQNMKRSNKNKEQNSNFDKERDEDNVSASNRKKRKDELNNFPLNVPLLETSDNDSKKRSLNVNPNERSVSDEQDDSKHLIEVSFLTKENKETDGTVGESEDNCPKPSVIPNKRELANNELFDTKQESGISQDNKLEIKRADKSQTLSTESYEEYEQRVAREIKNKIRLLKEEVKRELGALEGDKEEEDDEESPGETQRKKRFIVNTLMDEESQNIDPNENLENSELEPHVRRRRFLSTDEMLPISRNKVKRSFGKKDFRDLTENRISTTVAQPRAERQKPEFYMPYDDHDKNYKKNQSHYDNSMNNGQVQPNIKNLAKRSTHFVIPLMRQVMSTVAKDSFHNGCSHNRSFESYDTYKLFDRIKNMKERPELKKRNENYMDFEKNISSGGLLSKEDQINGEILIEKGKKALVIKNDSTGTNGLVVWNSNMKISDMIDGKDKNILIKKEEHNQDNSTGAMNWKIWKSYMNSLFNQNVNSYRQLEQNNSALAIKNNERRDISHPEEQNQSYSRRKTLSSQDYSISDLNLKDFNSHYQNDFENEGARTTNYLDNEYLKGINDDFAAEENEDNYYVQTVNSISNNVAESSEIVPKGTTERSTVEKSTEIIKEVEVTKGFLIVGKTRDDSVLSTNARRNADKYNSVGFKANKGDFSVQNKNIPLEDWKKRKRDLQTQSLFDKNKRRKRSWYWPSLSFLHHQKEDDSYIEQNESQQGAFKSSFANDDDEARSGEGDFDDFGDDPVGYERRRRGINSRLFYPTGNYLYYYPYKNARSIFLPVSRNKRYIQRQLGEPQQQLLTEISEAELFGALPQSYAGELTRYKRVKRTNSAYKS